MKTRTLAFIIFSLFMFSCATGPDVRDQPPEWYSSPPEVSETEYAFRGVGDGDTMTLARSAAVSNLSESVIEVMNLGDRENWSTEGKQAVDKFLSELAQSVRNPESSTMEGLVVARRDGWYNAGGNITYAVDILWDKDTFDRIALELADVTGVAGEEFRAFEARARDAEEEGNVYEAALLWAAAAGVAEAQGNSAAYRLALDGIVSAMDGIDYEIRSIPETAYVGSRPDGPVVFMVSAKGKPTGNAEFVITYPKLARDGTPATGEARINSDSEGLVRFLQPEVPFAGTQDITIAPSASPFLEYLEDPGNSATDKFIMELEAPVAKAEYEGVARLRSIPMGILILETDLTGNPLGSDAAARGLLDDLLTDGFSVEIMDLDPREMIPRSERALLRDIKADEQFSSRYERVLHARVRLESFEQDGDSYTVRVTGSLAMSDVDRQVTLFRSELSKSSRAASSQQAMSAAFRQLGRSFAEELIGLAP